MYVYDGMCKCKNELGQHVWACVVRSGWPVWIWIWIYSCETPVVGIDLDLITTVFGVRSLFLIIAVQE